MKKPICIVGAGFSGAVIAYVLAKAGYEIHLFEERVHLAGNCHTERDRYSGVMLHRYGPHIFHTSDLTTWNFINQFDHFHTFFNRVKAVSNNKIYSLPINLMTINSFFGKTLSPSEARIFIDSISDKSFDEPYNFEQLALKTIGKDLYRAFIKGYTEKQWGIEPNKLPSSILKRLPLRFNYDDNYYQDTYQGIPDNGYTYIISKMLDHPRIQIYTNNKFDRSMLSGFKHIFYSGPLDAWFNHEEGQLEYRTLDFIKEEHVGDYQGNAVINYCDRDVPYTRITEHKHFSPWEDHDNTVIYKEYSRACGPSDIPYYPVRVIKSGDQTLSAYVNRAQNESNITFIGRLGTYRYLDMHITISEALHTARTFLEAENNGRCIPAFLTDPIHS